MKRTLVAAPNSSYQSYWRRDLPDSLLRAAYAMSWDRLTSIFRQHTGTDYAPDPRLRAWEQLRRCPWALRSVDHNHPLGFPADHWIWQPVLAAKICQYRSSGATEWFHDAGHLGQVSRNAPKRRPTPEIKHTSDIAPDQLPLFEQCERFRRVIGHEYPRFARYEINSNGFKCYFLNNQDDENPTSFARATAAVFFSRERMTFRAMASSFGQLPIKFSSQSSLSRAIPADRLPGINRYETIGLPGRTKAQ
jgi:hypothetical protein